MLTLTSLTDPAPRERLHSNQPERRRAAVLEALEGADCHVQRVAGSGSGLDTAARLGVVSPELLDLLRTAHGFWAADSDRDEFFESPETADGGGLVPYFFTRSRPRPSDHLYRRLAWHSTDTATPLFSDTADVLEADAAAVCRAAELASATPTANLFVLTTHPGHHAARERYGGYCFVNWACLLVALLEAAGRKPFVVDVDHHAGDGTADMLRPEQFVSLHAAEDFPYLSESEPWAVAVPPGTDWAAYAPLLTQALRRRPADSDVLVVSLGADTLAGDPDPRPGHGMSFRTPDFGRMSRLLQEQAPGVQVLAVQEGGYNMADVPQAVLAFVAGFEHGSRPRQAASM